MGVEPGALDDLAITDPCKAVLHDIATLKAQEQLADTIVVTGLVYDVATGLMETGGALAPLRLPSSTCRQEALKYPD